MHLVRLTYWTSQLSLAYLQHAQNTYISLQLGKKHKACCIIKCSLSRVVYWILNSAILKVKTARLCDYRMVVRTSVVNPRDHEAAWELWLTATAQHHGRGMHSISVAWEEKNSKFEVWFLLNSNRFHTILQWKNRKWNQHKSGLSVLQFVKLWTNIDG